MWIKYIVRVKLVFALRDELINSIAQQFLDVMASYYAITVLG